MKVQNKIKPISLTHNQRVAGSSPAGTTVEYQALTDNVGAYYFSLVAVLSQFQRVLTPIQPYSKQLDRAL